MSSTPYTIYRFFRDCFLGVSIILAATTFFGVLEYYRDPSDQKWYLLRYSLCFGIGAFLLWKIKAGFSLPERLTTNWDEGIKSRSLPEQKRYWKNQCAVALVFGLVLSGFFLAPWLQNFARGYIGILTVIVFQRSGRSLLELKKLRNIS